MKTLIALLALITATSAFADNSNSVGSFGGGINGNFAHTDLNSTPTQLIAKYGKPEKVERAWYNIGRGTSYTFSLGGGIYLFATTDFSGTKIVDVVYTKGKGRPLTTKEKNHFLVANTPDSIHYYGQDYLEDPVQGSWNGNEDVPGHKPWFKKSDYNWTPRLTIYNRDMDDGAYQIVNADMFRFYSSHLD